MSIDRTSSSWLILALVSGSCAAFNGVFAKLTTTELTASWAEEISRAFGLEGPSVVFEYAIRALFFGLNLIFNGIMWGLFTRALTLATSTVRVSVINTSSNFVITALLGALIFQEQLHGLWWLGAIMLVAGSVIIGRREEMEKMDSTSSANTMPPPARMDQQRGGNEDLSGFRDDLSDDTDDAEDRIELGSVIDEPGGAVK